MAIDRRHFLRGAMGLAAGSLLRRSADPASAKLGRRLLNAKSLGEPPKEISRQTERKRPGSSNRNPIPTVPSRQGVRILVEQEGLVSLRGDELLAADFNLNDVDPTRLQLSFRGTPVPVRIVGEEDGTFDPADRLQCSLALGDDVIERRKYFGQAWAVRAESKRGEL